MRPDNIYCTFRGQNLNREFVDQKHYSMNICMTGCHENVFFFFLEANYLIHQGVIKLLHGERNCVGNIKLQQTFLTLNYHHWYVLFWDGGDYHSPSMPLILNLQMTWNKLSYIYYFHNEAIRNISQKKYITDWKQGSLDSKTQVSASQTRVKLKWAVHQIGCMLHAYAIRATALIRHAGIRTLCTFCNEL